MSEIEIIGLSRVSNHKPNKSGDTILAYFDARVGVIELRGCALVSKSSKGLTIWEPKLHDMAKGPRAIVITDGTVKRDLKNAAAGIYRALGGEVDELAEAG